MEWIKIKVQHVLNTGLTAEQIGRLVQFQALIALKERIPTDAEIFKIMRPKALQNLRRSLEDLGENLTSIGEKVLFDVQKTIEEREFQKRKKQIQREKMRLNDGFVPKDVSGTNYGDVQGQRREEKRREEKSVCSKEDTPHTFFKMAYRIFRLRKRRSAKPIDAGLLRHLIDLSHKSEERSAWAVEIEEYRRKLIKKRKDSLESRGKRTSNNIEQIESSKKEEIKRAIIQRYDSLPINVQSGVLDAAYEKYKLANGELRFIGQNKARKEFLKNILSSYISEVMSEMKEEFVV